MKEDAQGTPPFGFDKHWHLDKRVPIALILAILIQSGSAVWWASKTDSQVDQNTKMLESYQADKERLTRLEIYQESILRELKGIRSDLTEILRDRYREGNRDGE